VDTFTIAILQPFDLTLPGLIQRTRVDKSMRNAVKGYNPSGTVRQMDMFWVPPFDVQNATLEQWRDDIIGEWDKYTATPVRYTQVEGNHLTVMKGEDNVECFQKALNVALAGRGI
jgi:thioesterase domain-containing protein